MAQNVVPAIVSAASGGVAGGLGASSGVVSGVSRAASMAAFAPSVFGNAYKEGAQLGISDSDKVFTYALADTAAEVGLEALLGAKYTPGGGVLTGKAVSNLSSKTSSAVLKAVAKVGGNAVGEFVEEGTQGIISPLLQKYILGADVETIIDDPAGQLSAAAYDGFIGALSSAIMGGVGNVSEAVRETSIQNYGKQYNEILKMTNTDVKNVAQYYLEVSDSKALTESAKKVSSGDTSDLAVGEMLINAMRKPDGTYRTWQEMVDEKLPLKYEGKWVATACSDCDQETAQGNPFSVYMYCINLPVVQVNMETGKVKVVKFTMVSDFGTIINKSVVDGQVMGAIAQGIGLALTEDFEDLKKHTSLLKCGISYPNDIPDDIELVYQENHPRPLGPYGAAGCGEGPLAAPHPAILNAIYNATGARITRVPALPEVVKEALAAL